MSYPKSQELQPNNEMALSNTASLYLDALRLVAALMVFAYHAKAERLNGQWIGGFGNFGHDAVIVFFVLSGFVIAYTCSRRSNDFSGFMLCRFARLYSVALPALIFTVFADLIGQQFKPGIYIAPYFEDSDKIIRFITNLLFINEIWFTSWRAFSNGPFWSLSYEFFYYLIFATALYLEGWRRIFYTCLAIIAAGPKILLLLPTWLLGVFIFRLNKKFRPKFHYGLILFFSSIILYMVYRQSGLPDYFYQLTKDALGAKYAILRLDMSRWFINDYIVALLVTTNIFGVLSIASSFNIPHKLDICVRYLAGMTFTLYLFHYPLLQLYSSFLESSVVVVLLSLVTVMIIAPYTEGQKAAWLNLLSCIVNRFRSLN